MCRCGLHGARRRRSSICAPGRRNLARNRLAVSARWLAGRAFRCAVALCGDDVELYVRPKIGFCNCDSGIADDDEVDRVADLDLMSERFLPLEQGKAIRI